MHIESVKGQRWPCHISLRPGPWRLERLSSFKISMGIVRPPILTSFNELLYHTGAIVGESKVLIARLDYDTGTSNGTILS